MLGMAVEQPGQRRRHPADAAVRTARGERPGRAVDAARDRFGNRALPAPCCCTGTMARACRCCRSDGATPGPLPCGPNGAADRPAPGRAAARSPRVAWRGAESARRTGRSRPPQREAGIVGRLRAAGCVFAEDEARLLIAEAASPAALAGMVARRVDGEPLEQIVGWAEFHGLRVEVAPGVFVPRRRTEFLVDRAIAAAAPAAGRGRPVLRFGRRRSRAGRGGGRRRAARGRHRPGRRRVRAPKPARRRRPGVHRRPLRAAAARPAGRVGLLLVNAPYVPTDAIATCRPRRATTSRRVALDGGGGRARRAPRVIGEAPRWLAPGGRVLIETGAGQADVAAPR